MTADRVAEIRALLRGRIFGATFRKANGDLRTGAFRADVKLKDGEASKRAAERGDLVVWDMKLGDYRTIPLRRVVSLRVRGQEVRP